MARLFSIELVTLCILIACLSGPGVDATVCALGFVNCLVDPCRFASCPVFPQADCVSDFCGGCNANFFLGTRRLSERQCFTLPRVVRIQQNDDATSSETNTGLGGRIFNRMQQLSAVREFRRQQATPQQRRARGRQEGSRRTRQNTGRGGGGRTRTQLARSSSPSRTRTGSQQRKQSASTRSGLFGRIFGR